MDILTYFLSGLVLISLIGAMLFVTKAIKTKDNPKEKNQNFSKAGIAFFIYLVLNAVRMYLESNPI